MQAQAGNVAAAAKAFSLPEIRLRTWIRAGLLTPHACGRRSLILYSELTALIAGMPKRTYSRRTNKTEASNVELAR